MRMPAILNQIAQRMDDYKEATGHLAKHIYLGRLQQRQFDKAMGSPGTEWEQKPGGGARRQKFQGALVHKLNDEDDHLAVS